MKLVKLTALEAALAEVGYRIAGTNEPTAKAKPRKPLSPKARKAISKAMKARWAVRAAKEPT